MSMTLGQLIDTLSNSSADAWEPAGGPVVWKLEEGDNEDEGDYMRPITFSGTAVYRGDVGLTLNWSPAERGFSEKWLDQAHFPDPKCQLFTVQARYYGVPVRDFNMVYVDGGNGCLPLPSVLADSDELEREVSHFLTSWQRSFGRLVYALVCRRGGEEFDRMIERIGLVVRDV